MSDTRDPQDGSEGQPDSPHRLISITLDQASIGRGNSNIEHEREVAIFDILEGNHFEIPGRNDGPYTLVLGLSEDRLVLNISSETNTEAPYAYMLSLSPLKKVMKDYFMVCETYYTAIRTQPPSKIQAIDMGRRGLHNEGSQILAERLKGKITVDHDTARRLFTLICALHWKG